MPDIYIGLMSGTSMDGIDAVLASFDANSVTIRATHEKAYPDTLRRALLNAVTTPVDQPIDNVGSIDRQVGECFRDAALELLDGGPYDLLVTDMVMPRVDGAQVIREARKLLPNLPVICISGYTEESVLKEVESLDKLRFLSKPFSLKQLAGAVKEAIEKNAVQAEAGEE